MYNYMDYGMETIKRQSSAAYGSLVAGQSNGLSLRPIGSTPHSVCDTTAPLQLQLPLVDLCKCYAFTLTFFTHNEKLPYTTFNA